MPLPNAPHVASQAAILRLIQGSRISQALYVITKLGIPDLLRDGPKDSHELAKATETHSPSLYRLLRALASIGVVAQDDAGRFALTSLGSPLITGGPGSLRPWVLAALGGEHRQAWDHLMQSVCTGEVAFNHLFGTDVWTYRAGHPEHARVFDDCMANLRDPQTDAAVCGYPFAPATKVVDVGGGDGTLAIMLLQANPSMTGVVFDLPHVAQKAHQKIEAAGLTERCEAVGGDAFTAVPAGGDVYILSRVVHDWDDTRAAVILRNCRGAMTEGSRLLMIERVLPSRIDQSDGVLAAVLTDLSMMVMTGGRERTAAEFRALCDTASLRVTQIIPSGPHGCIIEAVPRE